VKSHKGSVIKIGKYLHKGIDVTWFNRKE